MESTWIRREGEGGEGKGKEGRGGEGILYDLPVDQGGEGRYIEGKFSAVHGGGKLAQFVFDRPPGCGAKARWYIGEAENIPDTYPCPL